MIRAKRTFEFTWMFIILIAVGFLSCRKSSPSLAYDWITIDENYVPTHYIEEFIKSDSESRGLLPVYIKNYDRDRNVLRRFRGTLLAKPNEGALRMAFPGLEDWMLIDLKYENEKKQEVLRTILYVQSEGQWKVGDSGRLLE